MRRGRIPALLMLAGLGGMTAGAGFVAHAAPPAKKATPSKKPASAKKPAVGKPPAKKAVPPIVKAVAEQIREQVSGPVRGFYAGRGYWPLWAGEGPITPAASTFLAMLESAGLDGLSPRDYDVPALKAAIAKAGRDDPVAIAQAELALSRAYARYVADLRRPTKVGVKYLDAELKPRRPKPEEVLNAAALATSFPDYIDGMGWMSDQYVRMRRLMATADRQGAGADTRDRIRLNMDRARMLPGPWVRHIVVDAASARLFYYQGGRQQGVMRVVVGTAETQTPMLAGMVRYAILNPYWNVPTDLAARRIAPKVLGGASLSALRYEALSDWSATPAKLDQSAIDWDAVAAGKTEVRLRQLPGGGNAMGRVKFMFPNDLGIYLHDTPDKELMGKTARHFSNGCVRLEDAPRLGRWLLGKPLTAFPKGPELAVPLADAVPVYLTYLTATATEKGVGFVADAYDRDVKG